MGPSLVSAFCVEGKRYPRRATEKLRKRTNAIALSARDAASPLAQPRRGDDDLQ
jgi:hypothetical protein